MQSCRSHFSLSKPPFAVAAKPTLMISASGSNPLQCYRGATLILWVIRLMNEPELEVLVDSTLIMLRVLHLGGARGLFADSGMCRRSTGVSRHCSVGNPVDPLGEMTSRVLGLPARGEDDVLDPFLPCATWAKFYESHQSEGHPEKGSLKALGLLQAVLILF